MKKVLLVVLIVIPLIGLSQKKDGSFEKTIKYGSSKDDAFTNTLIWAAETFNDSNEVIKMKDREAGILIIKGAYSGSYRTSFTMTFRFKNEECKVNIKNWKETKYGYTYKGFDNCYTRSCKKNLTKWMSFIDGLGESLVAGIDL